MALALNGEIVENKNFHLDRYFTIQEEYGGLVAYRFCSNNSGIKFKTKELAKKAMELTSDEDLVTLFGTTVRK